MLKYLQKANSDVTRKITVNIGQFRTVLKRGYSHKGIQPIPEFQLLLRWWLPPPLQPFLFGWTWGFELRFDLLCGCLFSSLRLFFICISPSVFACLTPQRRVVNRGDVRPLTEKYECKMKYSPELAEANTILCLEIFTSGEPRCAKGSVKRLKNIPGTTR